MKTQFYSFFCKKFAKLLSPKYSANRGEESVVHAAQIQQNYKMSYEFSLQFKMKHFNNLKYAVEKCQMQINFHTDRKV